MKTLHKTVLAHTSGLRASKETEDGIQIATTCLFPCFETVFVYVEKSPDGFIVHDAGETEAVIFHSGKKRSVARKAILDECTMYGTVFEKGTLTMKINSLEWLETAILSVASAAASASQEALKCSGPRTHRRMAEAIFQLLEHSLGKGTISKRFPYSGESGRRYRFDLAVQGKEHLTLIDTVSAHPNSVNSKYVAMADVPSDSGIRKIVAHSDDLSAEHLQLLQSVAIVSNQSGVIDLVEGSRPVRQMSSR